jgi:arylformamidase
MPQDAATTATGKKVYLDYTQDELDWQYDHTKRFPDTGVFNKERQAMSDRAKAALECRLDIPYGDGEKEKLDVFPAAGTNNPCVVFLHGGAWTRGSKNNYAFPAETFVPLGVTWIATDFDNIPPNTLDGMVRQNREAIAWIWHNAAELGIDRDRIHVAGHSSGGHLAGMMLITDWAKEYGLPADLIKSVTCISGMYDLEPIYLSYRNRYVKLDDAAWRRNSAILNIPTGRYVPDLIAGCSEHDTDEFHRQPQAFLEAWKKADYAGEWIEIMGAHHFSGSYAFNDVDGPLVPLMRRRIGV